MGLLSKLERNFLLDTGLMKAIDRLRGLNTPSAYTDREWSSVRAGLEQGNTAVAGLMKATGPKGAQVPADWEWGGYAHPHKYGGPETSFLPNEAFLHIPNAHNAKGVIYHSHPNDAVEIASKQMSISPLSHIDLSALSDMGGITSLDSQGGFGMAIANPRARVNPGEMEQIIGGARSAAQNVLGHDPVAFVGGNSNQITGKASTESLAGMLGVGRGLKNAGVYEDFDYLPNSEAQVAAVAKMEPGIEAAAQKAEEIVRTYLKARGLSDKDILGVIASAGGAAGLMKMAADIRNSDMEDLA